MVNLFKSLNVTVENYNFFLRVISILLMLIHVFLMICFGLIDIDILSYVNIISVIIYIFLFVIACHGTYPLLIFTIVCTEVLCYSTLAVIVIGDNGLFSLYCIAMYAYAFLTMFVEDVMCVKLEKKTYRKIIYLWFAIITLVFCFQQIYINWFSPIINVEDTLILRAFNIFNIIVVVCCVLMACGTLVGVANEYSVKLRKNIEEMERLVVEAEKANKTKGEFLANMSHEIRTPMNAICGMADFLSDEPLSDEAIDYVNTIKTAGSHLLSVINDILDFSKIESGKFVFVEEKYLYSTMVREIINIMTTRIKNKPLVIVEEIDNDIPAVLIGDVGRIRQVVMNIMNNAVKFTDAGVITVKSYFVEDDDDSQENLAGSLHFEISDTGRGIKQEDLKKLFDAFEQVDKKKNNGIEGTGLGLSICKMLVNGMDGEIFVESEYEKGSVFRFYVRQKIADCRPCNYNKSKSRKPKVKKNVYFQTKDVRALVVDDNRVNLKVAAGMLKRYNIQPDEVDCGEDAIELIKKSPEYDIIFMDHLMPEMDGIEATRIIRELPECSQKHLAIVALSANAVHGMEQKFISAGMDDFLAKPIETDNLTKILKKWLPKEKIIDG